MNRVEAPDECISRRALQEAFNSHCVGECSMCAFYGYELLDNGKYFYHCKLIDDAPKVEGKCRNALVDLREVIENE